MLRSLFSPAKYAVIQTKSSHSAPSYAEFPKGLVLDYEWQKHGEIWAIAKDHSILTRPTGTKKWHTMPGWATDITIADSGAVYLIGCKDSIWKYNGHKT